LLHVNGSLIKLLPSRQIAVEQFFKTIAGFDSAAVAGCQAAIAE